MKYLKEHVNIAGTSLLESFCLEEIHLQNPTSNSDHQVIILTTLAFWF